MIHSKKVSPVLWALVGFFLLQGVVLPGIDSESDLGVLVGVGSALAYLLVTFLVFQRKPEPWDPADEIEQLRSERLGQEPRSDSRTSPTRAPSRTKQAA